MKTMLHAFAKRLVRSGWKTDGKGHWSNGKAQDVWIDQAGNYEFGVWRVPEEPENIRRQMKRAGAIKRRF